MKRNHTNKINNLLTLDEDGKWNEWKNKNNTSMKFSRVTDHLFWPYRHHQHCIQQSSIFIFYIKEKCWESKWKVVDGGAGACCCCLCSQNCCMRDRQKKKFERPELTIQTPWISTINYVCIIKYAYTCQMSMMIIIIKW